MRTATCMDCGTEIVVKSVRGPMPKRCRACSKERERTSKKIYAELAKKAGRKTHPDTLNYKMRCKSLSVMSPVRRRIELRRRANCEYYNLCDIP